MTLRTLPSAFPLVHPHEVLGGRIISASIMRRLAQAQNYLWANLRNVRGHGAAGGGSHVIANWRREEWRRGAVRLTETLSDLPLVAPGQPVLAQRLARFRVPANWCSGNRLRVRVSGVSNSLKSMVCARLFDGGSPVGPTVTQFFDDSGALKEIDLELNVPQGRELDCVLWASASHYAIDDARYAETATLVAYSARYVNKSTDANGYVPQEWHDKRDLQDGIFHAAAPVFYRGILDNTLWHWTRRNPEVAHAWLAPSHARTTAWGEVGRYWCSVPRACTARYRLRARGLGSTGTISWRILVGGSPVASGTFAQNTTIDVDGTLSLAASDDMLVTLEMSCANNVSDWGAQMLGFQLDEESFTSLVAPPESFSPQDELMLAADQRLEVQYFRTLQRNDRWLLHHRPRALVCDWMARGAFLLNEVSGEPDYRGHFSLAPREPEYGFADVGPGLRNMTVLGSSGQDVPGTGAFPNGLAAATTGYVSSPYQHPVTASALVSGRLLGRYVHPASDFRARLSVRARRRTPHMRNQWQDSGGDGAWASADPDYDGQSEVRLSVDASVDAHVAAVRAPVGSTDAQFMWLPVARLMPSTSARSLALNGRIPPLPDTQHLVLSRPEGILFAVEVESMALVDEPLSQAQLNGL